MGCGTWVLKGGVIIGGVVHGLRWRRVLWWICELRYGIFKDGDAGR